MVLDELFERRLVVLSGKGGVGKSVVGAALALAARDRGLRTLLVEIEAPLEASRHLGGGPVGPEITEVLPGLSLVNLDPDHVLADYVHETVKVGLLARRVLDNPVTRRFYAAAPGLPQLLMLGKIMVLEEERKGRRRPRFDLILLDAPATGHGLSFLRVPRQASAAIPVGPVGNNARRIQALLQDPRRTALVVVAIPEEMAAVEAVELWHGARAELGMTPRLLVLNACHERRLAPDQEAEVLRLAAERAQGSLAGPGGSVDLAAALAAGLHHLRRVRLTRFYLTRLRRAVDGPVVPLPCLVEEALGPDSLRLLARRLEEA